MPETPIVVLVHGGFADASGFGGVIQELEAAGYPTLAPPNPLRSLSRDAASLQARVSAIDGPVVLVGHSYGGAVITQASATLDNVVALVYLAAFGIGIGESCASVQASFPVSMLATDNEPTSYEALGAAGGPDLYIRKEKFREVFCADSSPETSEVMFATQRPLSAGALTEKATAAGWETIPSWFLVSSDDNAIAPSAERFMAQRMGAVTETIEGSHTAYMAKPVEAANFIKRTLF